MKTFVSIATISVMLGVPVSEAQTSAGLANEILPVEGNLYRFRSGIHFGVFYATEEGILVVDPVSTATAEWLEAELDARFGVPVRYLVYSHDHIDHIAGGEVFSDTAVVISHVNARDRIELEEHPTARPQVTFTDEMTISVDSRDDVVLWYGGPSSSNSTIVTFFPEEGAMYVPDIVNVRRLPFGDLPYTYIDEWIDLLGEIERYMRDRGIDTVLPGHGIVGTVDDLASYRRYAEELREQVFDAIRAGKTLEETKEDVTMAGYQDWGEYEEYLHLNIEGMYRHIDSFYRRAD